MMLSIRNETPLQKKIKINRAKRTLRVKQFLSSANEQEKAGFMFDLLILESMVTHYATVSERLLVFIDNNIIQDILKREEFADRARRFHSFLAVLALAQDFYLIDMFACASPAILYEAGGKRDNCSVKEIEQLLENVTEAMAEVGLATHFVGFTGNKDLQNIFKKIAYDERQIRRAIDEVGARSWQRDFSVSEHGGMRIPLSLAAEECPEIELKYFHLWVVKWIFVHMIEKKMYRENKDQPKARGLMATGNTTTYSILKTKNAGVEGLGDIELLTHCDLVTQTTNNSAEIIMGLTYDERLHETLVARSGIVTTGPSFQGGGGDSAEDFTCTLEWSMRQGARMTKKANRRMREYIDELKIFHEQVLAPFIPWPSKDSVKEPSNPN